MAVEKQVILRGAGLLADTGMIRDDKLAGDADILPGMLLTPVSQGEIIGAVEGEPLGRPPQMGSPDYLYKHGPAKSAKVGLYALERDEAGDDLEVVYAFGDNVKYVHHVSGVVLNLLLTDDAVVAEGDSVVSAGNGALQAVDESVTAPDAVVGTAEETVSTSPGVFKRLAVRLA